MVSNLDIRLFDADDDEEDLVLKQFIQDVISATSTPAQAAADVSQWIINEEEKAWKAIEGKNLDDIEGSLPAICPNPRGHYELLLFYLAPVCSAYPPGHAVQENLLAFITEMRNLPDREMHQYTSTYNPDLERDESSVDIITGLWKEYRGVQVAFVREFNELDHRWSDVDTPGSETLIRVTNFQGFLTRLTTSNIVNFVYCCALLRILPSDFHYPDLEQYKKGGPRRIAGYLQAGATWMATTESTKWMYEESRRRDEAEIPWNARHWEEIKAQLVFIASKLEFAEEDKLLGDKAKALAIELRDRMDQFR